MHAVHGCLEWMREQCEPGGQFDGAPSGEDGCPLARGRAGASHALGPLNHQEEAGGEAAQSHPASPRRDTVREV